jgi:hypothetical protein
LQFSRIVLFCCCVYTIQNITSEEHLLISIAKLLLVLCILTVQVGSAFAVPQSPCANMSAEEMSQMYSADSMDASDEMFNENFDYQSTLNSMSPECCDNDCACDVSVINLVMAINMQMTKNTNKSTLSFNTSGINDFNIVLAQPQRPPKH